MTKTCRIASLFACAILIATPARAVDGVVLIDHAKALAGKVTPGDAAGYPVTLSLPGSYRLSGNLTVPASVIGIDAATVEITIDLNGFRVGGSRSVMGVYGTQRGLTVRNGTIRGFASHGIRADGAGMIVEDMRISDNGLSGVHVIGSYARIVNSTITGNTGYGIYCAQSCHIEGNYIAASPNVGVRIVSGTLLGNTIQANGTYGILKSSPGSVGYGNNTIFNNGTSVFGVGLFQLHPNYCSPAC